MNKIDLIKRINLTFETMFNEKITNFENLEFNKTQKWDSLKHIQLILALEKEFSFKIKTSEIEKLNSYKKIVEELGKKSVIS
jgi:acyl carrier protein|tara:strand:- start:34 stop:279 length:246 start_codon:yes stop_codon:yes gene_type:complete